MIFSGNCHADDLESVIAANRGSFYWDHFKIQLFTECANEKKASGWDWCSSRGRNDIQRNWAQLLCFQGWSWEEVHVCEFALRSDQFCWRGWSFEMLVIHWALLPPDAHFLLILPSHSSASQYSLFFLIVFAGRSFKRCLKITSNKEITAMIFCYFFFYFLIYKILKHGPEGKSHLPFKCEYLWIFGRATFKLKLKF